MKCKISHRQFDEIKAFSTFDKAFQAQKDDLLPFINEWASLDAFTDVIAQRSFSSEQRSLLVEALRAQYQTLDMTFETDSPIDRLSNPNTYTVITAHQPVLFGGPMYIVYKIASAIKLASILKDKFRDKDFVPVFIMGGEDHDFQEVNHANVFRKKIEWKHFQGGSVGRYNLNDFSEIIDQLEMLLGSAGHASDVIKLIRSCFTTDLSYGKAYQKFIHALFGKYGLLVVDLDDRELKRSFTPIMVKEVKERPSQKLIEKTQEELKSIGFKKQAHARAINLFYLGDDFRSVILFEDDKFIIRETNEAFSEDELVAKIHLEPENFSPNVVMRPIYQESVFPNLAYIGGGGELAYWSERKRQHILSKS
jgi:bacillithiol biosynthesis cysteine-adding enzyme BshC